MKKPVIVLISVKDAFLNNIKIDNITQIMLMQMSVFVTEWSMRK